MLCRTLKSAVATFKKFAGTKVYTLYAENIKENLKIVLKINRNCIEIRMEKEGISWTFVEESIEYLQLPDELTITLIEECNEINVSKSTPISFEAQLFIELFRVMKDRVYFQVTVGDRTLQGAYINRKMYVIDEGEVEYNVIESNLYKFNKTHGDFIISLFSPITGKMDQTIYLDYQRSIAEQLGKKYNIVRE